MPGSSLGARAPLGVPDEGAVCGGGLLLLRADGNREVGSGHVMRCCSIARAAEATGHRALLCVSDEASAEMAAGRGFETLVLGGDFRELGATDAERLARTVSDLGASAVLVDSYAATDAFLATLRELCGRAGVPVGYVDDEFRFSTGYVPSPARLPVDVVVGYAFGADAAEYGEVYRGTDTRFLVGPRYAPIREEFRNRGYEPSPNVRTILLTTGSTNPDGTLERFASCCLAAAPGARVDVVVGRNARFELEGAGSDRIRVHRDPSGMASLMLASDLVVSAAGTTIYELAALGVPSVAVPIVENQAENVRGWTKMRLGGAVGPEWDDEKLVGQILEMARDPEERKACSRRMRSAVDGLGARRIVGALLEIQKRSLD